MYYTRYSYKVKYSLDIREKRCVYGLNNDAGDGRIELPTAVLETAVMPLN